MPRFEAKTYEGVDVVTAESSLQPSPGRGPIRDMTWMSATAVIGLLIGPTTPVLAQSASGGSGYLEEVVVTAEKIERNLQDVPFSVSAVTGESLETFQYKDFKDLNGVVPNVEFTQITNVALNLAPSIRGIGSTNNPDPYTGTEVAVVIDGVVQGTRLLALSDQFDIERIEVLRGPQGTLFGADTLGGVVNVVSRAPTGEFGVYGNISVGNYDQVNAAAAMNFPIVSDVLAGKVSVSHRERDGFYKNLADGTDLMWVDTTKLRGYLRYTPSEDVTATLTVGSDHVRNGADVAANISTPDEVFFRPGIDDSVRFSLYSDAPGPNNADLDLYTLDVDWDGPLGKVTAIANYTEFDAFNVQDVDELPEFLLDAGRQIESYQYSGELRSAFSFGESLDVILGLFYMKMHSDVNTLTLIPGLVPGIMTTQHVIMDQKSSAIFGQAYWNLTSSLRLGLGLRGTKIETDLTSVNDTRFTTGTYSPIFYEQNIANSVSLGGFRVSDDESWTEPSGKISIDFRLMPDVMLYAYYARGFKSGGFNGRVTLPVDIGPYDPEFIDSFEVGMRSEWFDRRLRANLAIFYSSWEDMQVPQSIFTGDPPQASSTILNAASATSKGAEVELEFAPNADFDLRATFGYLKAEYDEFSDVGTDFSGRATPYSPEFTGSLTASYAFHTGFGVVQPAVQYSYVGSQWSNFTQAPTERIDSYGLVKANIEFVPDGQNWSLSLWATNLFDEEYVISSLDVPPLFSFATFGAPRQYGVDIRFEF
jgi:iron complex outermembrane receptor protein